MGGEIHNLNTLLECGSLEAHEIGRLGECREEIASLEAQLGAAQQFLEEEPENYDARIEAVRQEIREKEQLMACAALFVSKKAELLFANLRMNRVRISLYDVVKSTGEAKDAFRFTYNDRRYDRLSLSEKIRAGVEVSELMKRLTGRNYPLFVDNMESVDDLANVRPTGQVILARCVRGAELSVQPARQTRSAEKAA